MQAAAATDKATAAADVADVEGVAAGVVKAAGLKKTSREAAKPSKAR